MSVRVSLAAPRLMHTLRTGRTIADLPAGDALQTRADAFGHLELSAYRCFGELRRDSGVLMAVIRAGFGGVT